MANMHTPKSELAVVKHSRAVYDELQARSDNGVFAGSFVSIFDDLNVSKNYYKAVRDLLTRAGCVRYDPHPGLPSTILLIHPLRDTDLQELAREDLTATTREDTLREYGERLARLEAQSEQGISGSQLKSILKNFEDRIAKLESQQGES